MIVAERCRGLLFDALCDGVCEWFIVRRRFDFLAAADILRVRCRLSVDFACEIICFIYIMMGWRYHKCCDNGVNLVCIFSQGVSDNSDPTVGT